MATTKTLKETGKLALVGFDKAKVKKELNAIEADRQAELKANEAKTGHAFNVLMAAHSFSEANPKATVETIAKGWSDHGRTIATELMVKGSSLAEKVTPKKEGAAEYGRFVQYGQNIWSTGRGVIEYELNPADYESYQEVLKEVRAKRKAAKEAAMSDDHRLLAEAIKGCKAEFDMLLSLVDSDIGLVSALTEALLSMRQEAEAQAKEQEAAQAEAEQKEAANG